MFWDENYHIPSAQKHIDGILYMEPHPPLGKMLMGLSESVFALNSHQDMSALLKTDYAKAKDFPKNTQFFAFRLPSALLMGLSVFFFYHTLLILTKNRAIASIFSLFFIFDNALAVHTRAAMLEGIQIFFIALAIWYLVYSLSKPNKLAFSNYAMLGFIVGLAVAVKINSLILCLLLVILIFEDILNIEKSKTLLRILKKALLGSLLFFATLVSVMLVVMYIHIGMNSTIIKGHSYKASPSYINALHIKGSWSREAFYYGLQDHYRYQAEYAQGVPRLDACKKGGENGSSWSHWPFGGKSINYRWNKKISPTTRRSHSHWGKRKYSRPSPVAYSYLVANPFIWLSSTLGIIMSITLIISRFAYNTPIKDNKLFRWITYFTLMYVSYLIAIAQIDRVMYLYHYFIPLVFAIINLCLLFTYLFKDKLLNNNYWVISSLVGISFLTVGLFIWFSPLTYSIPLSAEQFSSRNWLPIWKMENIK